MTVYEYRRAGEVAGWDTDDVTAFLLGRGHVVGPGGVGCGVDGTAALVRADLERDPSADLDAYVPPPDPVRAALKWLRQRTAAIRAKDPATWTVPEKDFMAIAAILRSDL